MLWHPPSFFPTYLREKKRKRHTDKAFMHMNLESNSPKALLLSSMRCVDSLERRKDRPSHLSSVTSYVRCKAFCPDTSRATLHYPLGRDHGAQVEGIQRLVGQVPEVEPDEG